MPAGAAADEATNPQESLKDVEALAEDKPRKEWEKRGDLLKLGLNVCMIVWFQAVPLSTMFVHAQIAVKNDGWFHCEIGGPYDLSLPWACVCGYTQGVTSCFAPLSFCIMIIFIGRELVQKRLFYDLLRNHGVLQFASNDPIFDPLGIVVFVLYGHVILYFLFMVSTMTDIFSQESTSSLLQHAGYGHDLIKTPGDILEQNNAAFQKVSELFTFYLFPSTLFIVFFYCGYDIELTLVPLSQYVHDAHDAGESNQLSQLEILDDAHTKRIVLANASEILASAGNHEEEFDHLKRWYLKEDTSTPLPTLGLYDSLWPAMILLPKAAHPDGMWFRIMYYIYFGCSLFIGTLVFGILGEYIMFSGRKIASGAIPYVLQIVVQVVVAIVCMALLGRLIQVTLAARYMNISRKEQ